MLPADSVCLAVAFNVLGTSSYIRGVIAGRVRPNRFTWSLWAIVPGIAFAAELSDGVGVRSLTTLAMGAMPLTVVIVSSVTGHFFWRMSRTDVVCAALATTTLIIWWQSRNAGAAVLLSVLADLIAGVPTYAKAYSHPETENWRTFGCGVASGTITLLTVDHWTLTNFAFPLYLVATSLGLSSVIIIRGRRDSSWHSLTWPAWK